MSPVRSSALLFAVAFALTVLGGTVAAAGAPMPAPERVKRTARVYSSPGATSDDFGVSVAISGDIAVVGAPHHEGEGAAYVYRRTDTGWTLEQELPADPAVGDHFGYSVDIDGDKIVVGAPYGDSAAVADSGYVVVFARTMSGWTYLTELVPGAETANDLFGWSVACSGNKAVVGCPRDDAIAADAGAIFLYIEGVPAYTKYMSASMEAGSEYGTSVDISGDYVIAGAPKDDTAGGVDAGSARLYHWDGAFWDPGPALFASDPDPSDWFGYSVSISGDTAFVAPSSTTSCRAPTPEPSTSSPAVVLRGRSRRF